MLHAEGPTMSETTSPKDCDHSAAEQRKKQFVEWLGKQDMCEDYRKNVAATLSGKQVANFMHHIGLDIDNAFLINDVGLIEKAYETTLPTKANKDSHNLLSASLGNYKKFLETAYNKSSEAQADSDNATKTDTPCQYGDSDFLREVFIDKESLADMKELLRRKMNLILQGAPGTGKTFTAKRLAWCMMGEKDNDRIAFTQFHQSSSYDDFVIGYRPDGNGGFEIAEGLFVTFAAKAASDPGRDYFLVIDEINRANVSKVFGELLMLIEADHRNESLRLSVGSREFSVPKNLYIIGMMNTADRGLALIDYALRRRFAFFEMEPALSHPAFKESLKNNSEMLSLASAVECLNNTISSDPALGSGFRIGHSYFCNPDATAASVLRYEIEPLIREYWFDDSDRAEKEIKKLQEAIA